MTLGRSSLLLLVGVVLIVAGTIREALATGGGGQCAGQIVEENLGGVWVKTNAFCTGLCTIPPTCDLWVQRSSVMLNGHLYTEKRCACLQLDPTGLVIAHQVDGGDTSPCCDVRSYWSATYPYSFYTAGCQGTCGTVECGPGSCTATTTDITPLHRVITCACQ